MALVQAEPELGDKEANLPGSHDMRQKRRFMEPTLLGLRIGGENPPSNSKSGQAGGSAYDRVGKVPDSCQGAKGASPPAWRLEQANDQQEEAKTRA